MATAAASAVASSPDKAGKKAAPAAPKLSKEERVAAAEAEAVRAASRAGGFYCCGGNLRLFKGRARPGQESEDARFVYLKTPDYSTAFALRLLSGVPSYSVLQSPRVLDYLFPDADRARLGRRYATLAEAALFEGLDLQKESAAAAKGGAGAGGWESRDDLGVGTALEGSAITAPFGADDDDDDNEGAGSDSSPDPSPAKAAAARKKAAAAAPGDAGGDDDDERGIEMTSAAIRGAPPAPPPRSRWG